MSTPTTAIPKSTVVFVPGAFHTPEHYRSISALLEASSYQTLTVALPTIGARASSSSYRDDVHAIRSTLQELIEDQGKDVLLAIHSYGGVPGCQAIGGLEKSMRIKEGKTGGVVHVLFMAALLVEQGKRLRDALPGGIPPWATFDGTVLRPANVAPIFYSDLDAEEAAFYTSLLLPQSAAPAAIDVAEPCYDLDLPITYLLCIDDPAVEMLEAMMKKVKTESWTVERVGGGHSPFLGRKEELMAIIEKCLHRDGQKH